MKLHSIHLSKKLSVAAIAGICVFLYQFGVISQETSAELIKLAIYYILGQSSVDAAKGLSSK